MDYLDPTYPEAPDPPGWTIYGRPNDKVTPIEHAPKEGAASPSTSGEESTGSREESPYLTTKDPARFSSPHSVGGVRPSGGDDA